MKYLNLKNKILVVICLLTMFNSLSVAMAAEESFTLLGAATLSPVKNTNPDIYVQVTTDAKNVILRSDSSESARAIKTLPNNYSLSVLGSEYGWIYVMDDDNNRGYIEATNLTFKNGEKPDNSYLFPNKGEQIVAYAKQFIGTPYVWGGTDLKRGVDCSGLIYSVYGQYGIKLNRTSRDMYNNNGFSISKAELKPGDLIFFNTFGSGVSHVGMYVGDQQYIHSGDRGVEITSLNSSYSLRTYVGSKRIIA